MGYRLNFYVVGLYAGAALIAVAMVCHLLPNI